MRVFLRLDELNLTDEMRLGLWLYNLRSMRSSISNHAPTEKYGGRGVLKTTTTNMELTNTMPVFQA